MLRQSIAARNSGSCRQFGFTYTNVCRKILRPNVFSIS